MSQTKCVLLILLYYVGSNYGSVANPTQLPEYILEGEDFILICDKNVSAVGDTIWYLPDDPVAVSLNCDPLVIYEHVNISCSQTEDIQHYMLHIIGANVTRDDGSYKCSIGVNIYAEVDIHVHADISNATKTADGATCTTSCGYPANVTWYAVTGGTAQILASEPEVNRSNCGEIQKLRTETSKVTINEQVDQLKCCVANRGENDTSTCEVIDIAQVSTTTEPPTTSSDPSTVTSADPPTDTSADPATDTSADPPTDTSAAPTPTQNTGEVATSTTPTTPTRPDYSYKHPEKQVVGKKGENVILNADYCSEVSDSTVGWHSGKENCKSEDDLNESDLQKGSESNLSQCTDQIQLPFRTRSTWTVTAGEVACVTCCIMDRQELTVNNGTCVAIEITFQSGLSIEIIIVIVICCIAAVAAVAASIGGGICWKKKKMCFKSKD